MNPLPFILVLIVTVESLTALLTRIASARASGAIADTEEAIFSGWWFAFCMSTAAYTYFFLLSSDFHQLHARVKPASLVVEGFVCSSALASTVRSRGGFLGRETRALIAAPFLLLAALDLATGGRARDAILLIEAIVACGASLALIALGLLPVTIEGTRRVPAPLLSAFGLSIVILFAKMTFLPSPLDEPYASLVFFVAWSAVFAAAALGRLRRGRPSSANDEELVRRFGSRKGLSPREIELCAYIARGASNKQIAYHLSITEATVKKHFTSIFQKCGVSSRLELFRELSETASTTKGVPADPR